MSIHEVQPEQHERVLGILSIQKTFSEWELLVLKNRVRTLTTAYSVHSGRIIFIHQINESYRYLIIRHFKNLEIVLKIEDTTVRHLSYSQKAVS